MKRIVFLAILFISFTAANSSAACTTTVPGGTISGQTWTEAGSPYCVEGDLTVNSLTIGPGVRVEFTGNYSFTVSGMLTAAGTELSPILFTASDPTTPWKGIIFHESLPGSNLSHAVVEFANDSGLQIINCSPVIANSVFRNNTSSFSGGGIRASITSGDLTLMDCDIYDNSAIRSHGGGIYAVMQSGTLQLSGCQIRNNIATCQDYIDLVGGGIRISGNSNFFNCQVIGNVTYGYQFSGPVSRGGGIYMESGTATWMNLIVSANTAQVRAAGGSSWGTTAHGGGVYVNSGSLTAINTIVVDNNLLVTKGSTSNHKGCGLYVNGGSVEIVNGTIAYNKDSTGVHLAGGTMNIINSIIYFNNKEGTQVGGAPTITYSDVQHCYDGEGNICLNPVFVAPPDDYHLDCTISPCIDAGTDYFPGIPEIDIDGEPRVCFEIIDLGADECCHSLSFVDYYNHCDGNQPCYSSIGQAIQSAAPCATIKVTTFNYGESCYLNSNKRISLYGGYNNTYTNQANFTIIRSLTIEDGQMIVENLAIGP